MKHPLWRSEIGFAGSLIRSGQEKFLFLVGGRWQHALMMQTCVRSGSVLHHRAAQVREDFHVWSDRAIAGGKKTHASNVARHL
jgi:hypothetical protein